MFDFHILTCTIEYVLSLCAGCGPAEPEATDCVRCGLLDCLCVCTIEYVLSLCAGRGPAEPEATDCVRCGLLDCLCVCTIEYVLSLCAGCGPAEPEATDCVRCGLLDCLCVCTIEYVLSLCAGRGPAEPEAAEQERRGGGALDAAAARWRPHGHGVGLHHEEHQAEEGRRRQGQSGLRCRYGNAVGGVSGDGVKEMGCSGSKEAARNSQVLVCN